MKSFKPQLCPNEQLEKAFLPYPLLASYKLDGIRCIFNSGNMLSRSLKQFPNKQLKDIFEVIKQYAKCNNLILDGELLSKSVTFNELSGLIRQLDCKLPDDLYFYCFDLITGENFLEPFNHRIDNLKNCIDLSLPNFKVIEQRMVFNEKEVDALYEDALTWGCDGLILRNPDSPYKFGRATLKQGMAFKLKPFVTFDAKIIDVLQGTVVDPKAEKTINELGYSRTSKLKEDRLPSGRASDFVVLYGTGLHLKVSIAATQEEKQAIWEHKADYIGRWIEYKGMLVGAKDLPRHPVFLRYRDDKD